MVKIGIIGTGGMANHHAIVIQRDQRRQTGRPVAMFRRNARRHLRRSTASRRSTRIIARCWARRSWMGCRNVTPDALHAEISLAVIEHGIAILCEKPLATSLADAKKMRDAALTGRRGQHGQFLLPQLQRFAEGRGSGAEGHPRPHYACGSQLSAELAGQCTVGEIGVAIRALDLAALHQTRQRRRPGRYRLPYL